MKEPHRLFFAALAIASLACTFPSGVRIRGSGDVRTIQENISDFDRIDASTAFVITVTRGESYEVVVRIDDNLERYLMLEKVGDTLRLDLEGERSYSDLTLEADITMPALTELSLSGASEATISGFGSTGPFQLISSGASQAKGDIRAGDVTIRLSDASHAALTGEAENLSLRASGASEADLEDFPVSDADIELSGASNAIVNVSANLDATASGASNLEYTGEPRLGDIETSGASSIERR